MKTPSSNGLTARTKMPIGVIDQSPSFPSQWACAHHQCSPQQLCWNIPLAAIRRMSNMHLELAEKSTSHLTNAEEQSLEIAKQQNYLVCSAQQQRLQSAYFAACRQERKPCVIVRRQGKSATVSLTQTQYQWLLPLELQSAIRVLANRRTAKPGRRYFDVCDYGAAIWHVPVQQAEALAALLYLLAADSCCDFSRHQN